MYTLQKAKEEIDAVAKHATDIAVHAVAIADDVEAKLDSFKKDILSAIEEKFAELSRTIRGDGEEIESTAISDLGAKVSLLTARTTPTPPPPPQDHSEHHDDHQSYPQQGEHDWNHDQHGEHHQG